MFHVCGIWSHIDFKTTIQRRRHDGGMRGYGIHRSSQVHHEYINKWEFSQSARWPRGRPWTPESIRNHPPPMQPVKTKERIAKRKREGTSASDGGLKVERGSCTQKSPFSAGNSAGAHSDLRWSTGKRAACRGGRTKQGLHSLYVLPRTPRPELCVSCCRRGPDAGDRGLETGCRENSFGCKEKARRDGN